MRALLRRLRSDSDPQSSVEEGMFDSPLLESQSSSIGSISFMRDTSERSGALTVIEIPRREVTIMDRISAGGFSTVFRGKWRTACVAVKVLRCELGEKAYDALEAEIAVLSRLHHPRVLTLMGVCWDLPSSEGTVALVMELMERGSLYTILHADSSHHTVPPPNSDSASHALRLNRVDLLRLALDIADGMRFLHHSHVVHRDLKSGNVLVGFDWRAKIADFGLSSYQQLTMSHVTNVMGTAAWSAPEVILGEGGMKASADVYSFGVIAWELFTQQVPWAGKNTVQIVCLSMRGEHLAVPESLMSGDPAIASIIRRCFYAESLRPTFDDLHEEISTILKEEAAKRVAPSLPFPDRFICAIGYDVMVNPVICSDGHTYERSNIEKWLKKSNRSPKTNLLLKNKDLIPNYALRETIEEAVLQDIYSHSA